MTRLDTARAFFPESVASGGGFGVSNILQQQLSKPGSPMSEPEKK